MNNYESNHDQKSLQLLQLKLDKERAEEKIDDLESKIRKGKDKLSGIEDNLHRSQREVNINLINFVILDEWRKKCLSKALFRLCRSLCVCVTCLRTCVFIINKSWINIRSTYNILTESTATKMKTLVWLPPSRYKEIVSSVSVLDVSTFAVSWPEQ